MGSRHLRPILAHGGAEGDAAEAYKDAIRIKPKRANLYVRLAAVYVDLDRLDEAEAAVQNALRMDPGYTAAKYQKRWGLQHPEQNAWYRDLLLRAGLPE